jgi:hypothetical protein
MAEFMIDDETRRATGLCSSRGPRIGGEDSSPRCRLPIGHGGAHRPSEDDGWGPGMSWVDTGWTTPH